MNNYDETPSSSLADSPQLWGLETLIGIADLAAYLSVPVATIYDWRVHGKGPAAYRFGKHLKFAISDVRDWVAQQREPAEQREPFHRSGGSDRW